MAKTKIEWTDFSWNITRGCRSVSEGCRNCWAERQAIRHAGPGGHYEGLVISSPDGPKWTGAVRTVPKKLEEPLHMRKPQKIFVNSMSDLFHEDVPDEFIEQVLAIISLSPKHIFQMLTKRPERMRDFFTRDVDSLQDRMNMHSGTFMDWDKMELADWPLENLWLGFSAEDNKSYWERWKYMRDLSEMGWLVWASLEPLLSDIDILFSDDPKCEHEGGYMEENTGAWVCRKCEEPEEITPDWVVVGGESGPGARSFDLAWARSIVRQCNEARVPVFMKQLGRFPYDSRDHWITRGGTKTIPVDSGWEIRNPPKDKKGGDFDCFPEELKVREFPEVANG